MICPFLSARQSLAALVLAVSAIAISACSSNTGTSAALQPLVKHASGSLPITFNYQIVDAGFNTSVTGINDAQEIVGIYSSSSTSKSIIQSFTSVPSAGQYKTLTGNNYSQPYYGAPLSTSTALVAINPGKTGGTAEAGWVVNPGDFHGGTSTDGGCTQTVCNWVGGLANFGGLWTVFHKYASREGKAPCVVMQLQGINDSSEAVGFIEQNGTGSKSKVCSDYPFLVTKGEVFKGIDLSTQSFNSAAATGIDNTGDIVGWGVQGSGSTVGWYKSSTGVKLISVASSTDTQVLGINGSGTTLVGSYTSGGTTYGFLCVISSTGSTPCPSSNVQTGITGCKSCDTVYAAVSGVNDNNDICGTYQLVRVVSTTGFVGIPGSLRRRAAQTNSARSLQGYSAGPSH